MTEATPAKQQPRNIINVVGAAIVRNGKVLCAQRGEGKSLAGFWEFPGGKIEPHETAREALHREIEEELLCEVEVADEVCILLRLRLRHRCAYLVRLPSAERHPSTDGTP